MWKIENLAPRAHKSKVGEEERQKRRDGPGESRCARGVTLREREKETGQCISVGPKGPTASPGSRGRALRSGDEGTPRKLGAYQCHCGGWPSKRRRPQRSLCPRRRIPEPQPPVRGHTDTVPQSGIYPSSLTSH